MTFNQKQDRMYQKSISDHTSDRRNPLESKDFRDEFVECQICKEIVMPSDIINGRCPECPTISEE